MVMQVARVTLWGELVGALAHDTESHISTFEYAPKWLTKGIEISPIHLPLSQRRFQFPQLSSTTYSGLPGVFADSLMDGFGQTLYERWLGQTGKSLQAQNPLQKLVTIGKLGKGAIEYLPSQKPSIGKSPLADIGPMAEAASQISRDSIGLSRTTDTDTDAAMDQLILGGYRLSGSQPKAYFAIDEDSGEIKTGLAIPDNNHCEYLIKFGDVNDPFQANQVELAYGKMAQACGIDISSTKLESRGDAHHLVSDRFDRLDGNKLHFITYSGLAHTDPLRAEPHSYEQLFAAMRQLRLDRKQAEQMLRRMVFNVIACNHNDHSKSFGFLMNQTGEWRLAPAYGLTYSNGMGQQEHHQMSINGKTDRLLRQDLQAVVPSLSEETNQIIDEISARVAAWPMFARQAGISRELMEKIQRQHLLTL